ncbi:MAG: NAD(P)H-dependent oxidoreductase [Pseudomonadota bacterium]
MSNEAVMKTFIADWFQRFDRLDPPEAFLKDLDRNVEWDMPNVSPSLHGHDRFLDWYAGVLESFEAPTEHHVSKIALDSGTAEFEVLFRARLKDGSSVEARVREQWRYILRPEGQPLITHYSATSIEEETKKMKTLVLTAHPDLTKSQINRQWFDALTAAQDVTTRDLTAIGGPAMKFDLETEQALLLSHERIVFQFPFYWYSAPPVLKAWMDQTLSYGFAYGPGGDKLKGRELLVLVSTGGPADSYHAGGYNNFSMDELLKPFQQTALLAGMTYLRPYVFYGMAVADTKRIEASIPEVLSHIANTELDPKVKLSRLLKEIEAASGKMGTAA